MTRMDSIEAGSQSREHAVDIAIEGAGMDAERIDDGGSGSQRLTEDQIEEISHLLRAGRRLPPHLFPNLFETSREYELAYRGKARRADILAETMAIPLQPVRSFGASTEDWSNMLILGDNLQVLRQLLKLKDEGLLRNSDGVDGVRLCYIDPPFASQREFTGSRNEKAYIDRVAGAEFVEHLRRRLVLISELLSDNGSLFMHLDTRKVHYIKVVLDEIFGESGFRNEIIWKRSDAHSDSKQGGADFGRIHDTILRYTKAQTFVFNPQYSSLPDSTVTRWYRHVDEATGRRFNNADLTAAKAGGDTLYEWNGHKPPKGRFWAYSRAKMEEFDRQGLIVYTKSGKPYLKRFLDESKGVALQDMWLDIDMLRGISGTGERAGYPTQKPLQLLERIINVASNEGDLVLDCFAGSGTTMVAADRLNRRWVGIDSGKFAIYVSQARLLRQAGKKAPDRPFTLYNAGLYDYGSLRDLPWKSYLEFVLQLFQCQREEMSIAGVTFHGFLGDHPVLVYNFKEHPSASIGLAFIDDIASLCRGRLGSRCFIIAPASVVEPYEDYVDHKGTRFFFLRIPYSIIAELHKRAFSELRQPTSVAATNVPIDSVGFDFVQPPRIEAHYSAQGTNFVVAIREFESEAFAAVESVENIENLAMVLVDYSYDGEVFDFDAVHFAEDLAQQEWNVIIPQADVGQKLMLIYIDIYGNEHREVKTPIDFGKHPGRPRKTTKPRPPSKADKKPPTKSNR